MPIFLEEQVLSFAGLVTGNERGFQPRYTARDRIRETGTLWLLGRLPIAGIPAIATLAFWD